MSDICPKCGLPKDLCICGTLGREKASIVVKAERARFNKVVTVISGIPDDDLKRVAKFLKKKLACGGSFKKDRGEIILQGDHREKIAKFLNQLGYSEVNVI